MSSKRTLVVGGTDSFVKTEVAPHLASAGLHAEWHWDYTRSVGTLKRRPIPAGCEVVIVMLDMVGHELCDYVRSEVKNRKLPVCFTVRKWAVMQEHLRTQIGALLTGPLAPPPPAPPVEAPSGKPRRDAWVEDAAPADPLDGLSETYLDELTRPEPVTPAAPAEAPAPEIPVATTPPPVRVVDVPPPAPATQPTLPATFDGLVELFGRVVTALAVEHDSQVVAIDGALEIHRVQKVRVALGGRS